MHFVLVHSAGHGAWCWYKIIALMRSSGHNVTAIDLGASEINPKQAPEIPHFSDYLSPLMEFMASFPADKKVVLVGHSFGGLAISKAMETFPEKISAAVFLSGLMPGPNINATTLHSEGVDAVISQLDNHVTYDNGPTNPPTTIILGPKFLATNVYQLSPNKDLALATTLVRPYYLYSVEDVSKELVLSSKRYGSVRRVFIVADENKALKKEFIQLMIEKNPPDEVEEFHGSDHMTMMSRPQQLYTTLLSIASKYQQVLEVPHLSDYFSPLMKFMDSLPAHEKVVLVGHELGCFTIFNAMESFPEKISVAVFVTALMPGPTLNASPSTLKL